MKLIQDVDNLMLEIGWIDNRSTVWHTSQKSARTKEKRKTISDLVWRSRQLRSFNMMDEQNLNCDNRKENNRHFVKSATPVTEYINRIVMESVERQVLIFYVFMLINHERILKEISNKV